jgi:hypothetical protein
MLDSTTDETTLDEQGRQRLELAWQWLNEFPVNPHPDLGRDGPVCPYMGRALQRQAVRLFAFDARQGDDALEARARALREEFVKLCHAHSERTYFVFFVVPYGLPEPDLKAMVERVHGRLRPDFVQTGMLAGDFWPDHETLGLHSDSFRPFASPLPILGMRNMVPGDLAFFANPAVPAETQLTYLGYYRRAFDGKLSDYWRERLDTAETAARAALSERPGSLHPPVPSGSPAEA